jgi:hypothetical protein
MTTIASSQEARATPSVSPVFLEMDTLSSTSAGAL